MPKNHNNLPRISKSSAGNDSKPYFFQSSHLSSSAPHNLTCRATCRSANVCSCMVDAGLWMRRDHVCVAGGRAAVAEAGVTMAPDLSWLPPARISLPPARTCRREEQVCVLQFSSLFFLSLIFMIYCIIFVFLLELTYITNYFMYYFKGCGFIKYYIFYHPSINLCVLL